MWYICIEHISSYKMVVLLSKPVKIVLSAQPGRIISAYVCLYSSIQLKVPLLYRTNIPACVCSSSQIPLHHRDRRNIVDRLSFDLTSEYREEVCILQWLFSGKK